MTEPIRKQISVPLDPDAAFDLFTAGISSWWPGDTHSLSATRDGSAPLGLHVEPYEGGRVIETASDGVDCVWAHVARWDPGRQLTLKWHVGRHESEATDLDIRFLPSEAGTLVRLTHGGFDRLGSEGTELSASYDSGWSAVLVDCFGARCRTQIAA